MAEHIAEQKSVKLEAKLRAEMSDRDVQAERAETQRTAWETKVTAAESKHPDYRQLMNDETAQKLMLSGPMSTELQSSEVGPEILYWLRTHPDETQKLYADTDTAALPATLSKEERNQRIGAANRAAMRAIARIEASLGSTPAIPPAKAATPAAAPDKRKPAVSQAEAPITPLGGEGRASSPNPNTMSTSDYLAWIKTPEGIRYRESSRR